MTEKLLTGMLSLNTTNLQPYCSHIKLAFNSIAVISSWPSTILRHIKLPFNLIAVISICPSTVLQSYQVALQQYCIISSCPSTLLQSSICPSTVLQSYQVGLQQYCVISSCPSTLLQSYQVGLQPCCRHIKLATHWMGKERERWNRWKQNKNKSTPHSRL